MKIETIYQDPMDVFRWVADAFTAFKMVKSYRHPQGYCVALFRVTWDGETRLHQVRASARRYSYTYNHHYPHLTMEQEAEYRKAISTADLAGSMIRNLPRDDAFHLAQNLILHNVLYFHARGWGKETFYGMGRYYGGTSIQQAGDCITVTRNGQMDKFTVNAVDKSIRDQLCQIQQLRLF